MKICVIGNSHIASLIQAWEQLKGDYAEIGITYFGAPSTTLKELKIKDGALVPVTIQVEKCLLHTSGGYDRIIPINYDVILIYGCELNLLILKDAIFYSKAAIQAAYEDNFKSTLSYDLLSKLRILTQSKIFIGHNPLKAMRGILSCESPKTYLDAVSTANTVLYKKFNTELITQPVTTIVNSSFTHPDYSKNSKKLIFSPKREYHNEEDIGHMNDEFGKIWLKAFLEILGGL